MSIVTLNKVTVFGLTSEREMILEGLQRLGCMHLIPLQSLPKTAQFGVGDRYDDAQKALRYLMDVPRQRHPVLDDTQFNLEPVVTAALANQQRRREVEDQRLSLNQRLRELAPWGSFTLPDLQDLGGYRLWFYRIPHTKAQQLQTLDLPWQIVGEDSLHVYVVVIAQTEPPAACLPVARTHAGAISPEDIKHQLNQVEIELDDIQAEHEALSRWIFLLSKNLVQVEDQMALQAANLQAKAENGIFMVQGWVPKPALKRLDAFTEQHHLAFWAEPPRPDETPPTLIENPPVFQGGQDLVTFYETPGYRTWDPSWVVFFSFALFFAMILSDAGYAIVLFGLVGWQWRSLGNSASGRHFRIVAVVGLTLAVLYGILVGSYFGVGLPPTSLLAHLKVFNLQDYNAMMQFAIGVGCLHLAFANAIAAYQSVGFPARAQCLGWIAVILGGFTLYLGWQHGGIGLLLGGFLVIFLGGLWGSEKSLPLSIIDGLSSLVRISTLFGDIMSYLRLFALGLASASLALTFNQLALQVYQSVPGLGLLIAMLILLLGHGINLVLAIISGFVHGLRLNYIEFFNWSLPEEGYPFQAFAKKEHHS